MVMDLDKPFCFHRNKYFISSVKREVPKGSSEFKTIKITNYKCTGCGKIFYEKLNI